MPEFFLDNYRHPYLRFEERFVWPSVHLISPHEEEIYAVRRILEVRFPGFGKDFAYWENDPFSGNQKYLVFVAVPDDLREMGMAFEVRVLAAYAGGAIAGEIRRQAEQDRSPEFETDRIYFKSFLFPFDSFAKNSADQIEHLEVRTFREILEASRYTLTHEQKALWATALFDSIDYSGIQERLRSILSSIAPWRPGGLYPPIVIERMTFCLQVLNFFVARNMAAAFREFVEKIQDESPDTLEHKQDWMRFNRSLTLERIISRGGNPHWRFVNSEV